MWSSIKKVFKTSMVLYVGVAIVCILSVGSLTYLFFNGDETSTATESVEAGLQQNATVSTFLPKNVVPQSEPIPVGVEKIPTLVLAADIFLEEIKNSKKNTFIDPVINPTTATVVASRSLSNNEEGLDTVAARVLPEQYPAFSDAFGEQGNPANVYTADPNTVGTTPAARRAGEFAPVGGLVMLVGVLLIIGMAVSLYAIRSGRKSKKEAAEKVAILEAGEEDTRIRFADVAGVDEAVEDLQEVVDFIREPERFEKMGASPPNGALLIGPPGTGKTMLARAVAGEADVPFYTASGSDFVEKYVGVGAKRVRELFEKAKAHPEGAIIFIDEIDAVGRKRESGGNSHVEQESTLNALLVEMDGFHKTRVVVLGATNRDDMLDPALTRPGRLDRKVQVPLPDRFARERILGVHVEGKPISKDVDLTLVARRTPGMSGANLAQLVNEACLQAVRENASEVSEVHFDHAVATVAMGKARVSAQVTSSDRLVTAWHEAGHTVSAMVLPDADDPVSVSIIPRGPAGGVTWMASGDDIFLTRKRAYARLVVAMSGRAAEELLLDGEFTSGPHGDLQAATQTALEMVSHYGMTDAGLMIRSDGLLSTGSQITDATVEQVEILLAEALTMARTVLSEHRGVLENVVEDLLEKDTLTVGDLNQIREKWQIFTIPDFPPAPAEYRKTFQKTPERVRKTRSQSVPVRYAEDKTKKSREPVGVFSTLVGKARNVGRNSSRKKTLQSES